MNLAIVKKIYTVFFVLFPFIFLGCTKIITTDIGSSLLPGIDNLEAKDLFLDVQTKNGGDSANHVAISQDFSLGYISNDPIFGKTSASVNVQLVPSTFPVEFGSYNKDSVWFDSAVLVLSYKGVWGDSFQNLAFRVYQISSDQPFSPDSVYSTSHFFQKNSIELTQNYEPVSVNPRTLADSVYPYKEAATNQLRIPLDKEAIGNKLVYGFDTSNAYKSLTAFNQYFRGFQVVPEQQGNSLLRVNILDTNTKLAIYYRYGTTSGRDTGVTYFKATSGTTAAANYIKRDRNGANVQTYYPSGNTQDSLLFLEAGPGIFTNVTVPDLTSLSKIVIQRAELLMDQVPDEANQSDLFLTPPQLFLSPYSTQYGKRFLMPGSQVLASDSSSISNVASLGVVPIATVDPVTGRTRYTYSFDITKYVQGVVSFGQPQYNFVLYAPGNDFIYAAESSTKRAPISSPPLNAPAQGRVRLGGGNSISHRMRLHIVYSPAP
ncbi:MAG TPA: DUF4270 family protein [Chitinophagaceae bacterium]|nr:DUF4270 family protein [Chitinophagaceae bacterium]